MTYSDTTLVIPTLNEKHTLPLLMRRVLGEYPGLKILIVDDGSTDGTTEEAEKFYSSGRVDIINRKRLKKKPGLTASVIDGIMASKTQFVIVMDADLQHPQEKIREIHVKLSRGSKLVVAVRETVIKWPFYRKVISKLLSSMGYLVLFARGKMLVSDIFSGFFGADRKTATNIISKNRKRFIGEGYKVLFDLLKCIDARDEIEVSEVKYHFGNRKFGESKAGAKQVVALLKSYVT